MTATSASSCADRAAPIPAGRRRALTAAGVALFLAAGAAAVWFKGVFLTRDWLFAWLLLGALALSLADVKRWLRGLVVDWLPFMGVLLLYDLSRPVSGWLGTQPHVAPQLDADRLLFGRPVPTLRLQDALYVPGDPGWHDFAAWSIYVTHFFATLLIAALLWRYAHHRFRRFRAAVLTLATAGFVTYVLFPAVPPWLASVRGELAPTHRILAEMWGHLGIQPAAALFENRGEFYNEVAAVPSLHAAYPLLFLLFFWGAGRWVRLGLAGYTLAMALALVYTAEHYVSDILLGWVYAGATMALLAALRRRKRSPAGA